jgi:hypothetical protein
MVVAVENDAIVRYDDVDEGLEICLVGCGGAVRVVELEEFPGRLGLAECVL